MIRCQKQTLVFDTGKLKCGLGR